MKSGQMNRIPMMFHAFEGFIGWTQRRRCQNSGMVIEAAPSCTGLRTRSGQRVKEEILRGLLANWLLDPSLMPCPSFASLSSLHALSERLELNSTLQALNKWLKAVWLWASAPVCWSRGNNGLILSRVDSGKHTLKSRAGRSTVS